MGQQVCYLCGADAQFSKESDPESRSLISVVECTRCGHYRLTPQTWTGHERSCLAAYVRYENKAGRRPPLIGSSNWRTMVKLGEALLKRASPD
jgi:hypothetical protein